MPAPRRIIRRLPPHRIADFDDYLWPVNVALLVFGACVAGVIVFESDFRTTELLYNGWVRLGTLAAVMGVLIWGMLRLHGQWSHRMQLSVLLALITHLWGGVYLHEQRLAMTMAPETSPIFGEDEASFVTLPDYDFQTIERNTPDESIVAPTAIEAPDVSLPREIVRAEPLPRSIPERSADEPAAMEFDEPDVAPLNRAEAAAPRRSELASLGQLSRQEQPLETTVELVDTPSLASAEAMRREQLSPTETAPQRQAMTPERINRLPSVENSTEVRPLSGGLMRRNANDAPATEGAAPAAARGRSLASVDQVNNERIASDPLPGPAGVGGAELQPRVDDPTRMAGGGPWRAAAGSGDRFAGGTAPGLREGVNADFGGLAPANDPRGGGAAPGPVSRTLREGGGGAPIARTTTGGAANLDDSALEATAPRRGAGGGATTTLEPFNTGIERGSGGIAGRTRQGNFDLDLAGGGVDSASPSAAARRAAARDENPTGTGESPSRPSQLARSRAGGELPSAAFSAEDIPFTDAAGASRPGRLEASSSAAVTRSESGAARGPVTASAGSSLIDLGSGRSTVSEGPGRSSGGGDPTVSSSYQPGGLPRGTSGASIGSVSALDETGGGDVEVGSGSGTGGGPGGRGRGGLGPVGPGGGGIARNGAGGAPARRGNGGGVPGIEPALGGVGGSSTELSRPGGRGNGEPGPSLGAGTGSGVGTGRTLASANAGDVVADDPFAGGGQGNGNGTDNGSGSAVNGTGSGGGGTGTIGPRGDGIGDVRRTASGGGAPGRPGGVGDRGTSDGTGLGNGFAGPGSGSGFGPRRSNGDSPAVSGGGGAGSVGGRQTADAAFDDDDAEIGPIASAGVVNEVAGGNGISTGVSSAAIGPTNRSAAVERQRSTVPVRQNAPPGAGGLGNGAAVSPGIPDRRARPESDVVHTSPQRFVLDRSGGASASIDAKADTGPVQGFRQRNPARRGGLADAMGGNDASEQAVELGLDFLARHQLEDGRWSLHNLAGDKPGYENAGAGDMKTDTAATGLALLAFYGAGYTHSDGKYREVVRRGLDHLLSHQKSDGDLFVPQDQASARNVQFYSHGIASIALCEAYGMTRDKDLREPAQRALDFIVSSQHPNEGGWRYSPRGGSDTSVSGWQMMAMKSGELAGLRVPTNTYGKLRDWLEHASTPWGSPARYAYRPRSVQQNQAQPSLAMTAEGLLMQQYLGWQRDNPYLRDGAEYLKANLPSFGTAAVRTRDCYYWYYATQVMFQMQGEYWSAWNERLRPMLIDNQVQTGQFAGSWEPTGETPDRWGPRGGRLYVTCLHLLMLEVYYRHLPLYRDLNVAQSAE